MRPFPYISEFFKHRNCKLLNIFRTLWNKQKKPNDILDNNNDGSDIIEDGLEDVETEITRLRWPHDQRVSEVRKLLQSARPVIIGVQQRPEVSDHDFVEEQERNLQSLCIRTMALPVGRGAMAFQCAAPLPTEPVRRNLENFMKFLFW